MSPTAPSTEAVLGNGRKASPVFAEDLKLQSFSTQVHESFLGKVSGSVDFFLVDLSQEDGMICTWDKAEDGGISWCSSKNPHFSHLSVLYQNFSVLCSCHITNSNCIVMFSSKFCLSVSIICSVLPFPDMQLC